MPAQPDWLTFKISEKNARQRLSREASIFISVPKKTVPLATKRNRIKRLIREAARHDGSFKDRDKVYLFRVLRAPLKPSLVEVQGIIKKIRCLSS